MRTGNLSAGLGPECSHQTGRASKLNPPLDEDADERHAEAEEKAGEPEAADLDRLRAENEICGD